MHTHLASHRHTCTRVRRTSSTNKWINQGLNKSGDLEGFFFRSFLLPHPFLPTASSFSPNRKREIELKSAFDISSLLQISKMIRPCQRDDFRSCFTLLLVFSAHPHPSISVPPASHPTPFLWLESGNPFAVLLSDPTQAVSGSLHTSPSVLVPSFPSLSPPFPFFLSFAFRFRLYPLAVCCRLCGEFAQITCHTGSYV